MTDATEPAVTPGDEAFYAALVEDDAEELYDRAPCAYLSALPDGTIVKVNGTFLAWTGHRREELVGRKRFQHLLAPGDRIFHETHIAPLLRMQGRVREIAVDVVCDDGTRLPVLMNSVLKQGPDGEPLVVRTALFDAKERRAYERELLAARRRAEESEARAKALARTLQASLLPPAVVAPPGLDIGAAYRPAGDGSEVGGDFYDVFETARGTWAVVLGDVCGKGPAAAVVTALARYTVRAEALHSASPSAVLAVLHEALVRYHPEQFCTAVFAVLDPARPPRFTVASGGHPLPLVRRAGGGLETVGRAGRVLGLLDPPALEDTGTELAAGDLVVLYTDGVTEARRDGEFFDDERLVAVIADAGAGGVDARELASRIVTAAVDYQRGDPRDDIAVVVVRVPR